MIRALRAFALLWGWMAMAALAVPADSLRLENPVVDQANVLAPDAERELDALLRDWRAQGLMQGAVVLVDSTDGMNDFDYAMQLARRWQLGDKARDNGLLLLVAVHDRKLRIVTGSGIEGALPDISTKKIIRETITPYFRSGDYAGGVRAGLEAAAARLAADPAVQAEMVAADREAGNARQAAPRHPDSASAWHRPDMRLFGLLPLLFILILAMLTLRGRSERGSPQHRVAHGVFTLASGSMAGIIVWLGSQIFLFALGAALYVGFHTARDDGTHITRRRPRDDDDDDWFSGGFGGGFGGSGGFGGGGGGGFGSSSSGGGSFSGGGGYSGDGGSFSGGGAGGSW